MKKKVIFLSIAILFVTNGLLAQYQHRGEISLNLGGGFSTLHNDLSVGKYKMGFGGNSGITYTFFFNKYFGLGIGAEASYYQSEIKISSLSDYYVANDGSDLFVFSSTVSNYKETQQALFDNVPLMLHFQSEGKHKFYFAFGGKIGIPIDATFKATTPTLTTSAYYPQWNASVYGPTYKGFGTFNNIETDGDFNFEIAYMGFIETGMKWQVSKGMYIYTGLYVDCGFNDIYKKGRNNAFVSYHLDSPTNYNTNSIVVSQYAQSVMSDGNISEKQMEDKIYPLSFGLKFRFSFGVGGQLKLPPSSNTIRYEWDN